MRVSVLSDDHGYTEDPYYNVFLDGVQQQYVLSADEELGYVLRAILENGKPFIRDQSDEIATEEVYGEVRLEAIND